MRCAPKKLGHNKALGCDTVALPPPTLTRRRDPNGMKRPIYDDIRVSSIVMRQGPMKPGSPLLFGVASRLAEGRPSIRCVPRCLRYRGTVDFAPGEPDSGQLAVSARPATPAGHGRLAYEQAIQRQDPTPRASGFATAELHHYEGHAEAVVS